MPPIGEKGRTAAAAPPAAALPGLSAGASSAAAAAMAAAAAHAHSGAAYILHPDGRLNADVVRAEYAVRGRIYQEASKREAEGEEMGVRGEVGDEGCRVGAEGKREREKG